MDRRGWFNGKVPPASLSTSRETQATVTTAVAPNDSPVVRQSQSDGHDGDGVSLVLCVKDGWAVQNAGKLAQRTSTQLHEHKRTTANRAAGAKQHL